MIANEKGIAQALVRVTVIKQTGGYLIDQQTYLPASSDRVLKGAMTKLLKTLRATHPGAREYGIERVVTFTCQEKSR